MLDGGRERDDERFVDRYDMKLKDRFRILSQQLFSKNNSKTKKTLKTCHDITESDIDIRHCQCHRYDIWHGRVLVATGNHQDRIRIR